MLQMRYGTAILAALLFWIWPSPTEAADLKREEYFTAYLVASQSDADYFDLIEEWESVPEYAREAILRAVDQLGSDYVYASSDPDRGFDCSGLVRWAWASVDDLPRNSRAQIRYAYDVNEPRPGDVLYYPGHIMIYLGDGVIIHAANSRTGVVLSDLPERDVRVGRLLPPVGTNRAF